MSDELYLRGSGSVLELDGPKSELTLQTQQTPLAVETHKSAIELRTIKHEVHLTPFGGGTPPAPLPADIEIYAQPDQPAEGDFVWYWYETDVDGNPTGNEYLYIPDGA